MSDVAWAPLTLRIPHGLVSLRARNAAVVAIADTSGGGNYALTTLVLDDNALAPAQQSFSLGYILMLTETLQVFSCQRCGLRVDVGLLVPGASASTAKVLQELHVAQVSSSARARGLCRCAGGESTVFSLVAGISSATVLCCAVSHLCPIIILLDTLIRFFSFDRTG